MPLITNEQLEEYIIFKAENKAIRWCKEHEIPSYFRYKEYLECCVKAYEAYLKEEGELK